MRLPIELWPSVDADRWANAKVGGKLFDKGGAADWRPATVSSTEKGYAVYPGWLRHRGMLNPSLSMEERVSTTIIERFVAEYQVGRAPLTVAGAVRAVALMMRACSPPDGVQWLSELAWSMMNGARPVRPKLPRIASTDELLQLANKLMQEGRETWKLKRKGALTYRDGLMIACLTARPMRLSEFMSLRLGTTLVRQEKGWLIDIPPGMTKKSRRRRQFFPDAFTAAIDFYVEHVRATLPSPDQSIQHRELRHPCGAGQAHLPAPLPGLRSHSDCTQHSQTGRHHEISSGSCDAVLKPEVLQSGQGPKRLGRIGQCDLQNAKLQVSRVGI